MDLVHIRGALAKGADVAKWIKAMDCGSITRGFNPRRSPIQLGNSIPSLCLEQRGTVKVDGMDIVIKI